MSFQATNSALTQAYLDLNIGLPTAYEGIDFEPPAAADWAALSIIPAINAPTTLGKGGQDQEDGILQIDFFTVFGKSTDALLTYANTVQTGMVSGMSLLYDDTTVWISAVERTNVRTDDGWLRITINVVYLSRFTRPTF